MKKTALVVLGLILVIAFSLFLSTYAPKCGYDYNLMPRGNDQVGIPLADKGIKYEGKIKGPAFFQYDSGNLVAVFPDNSWYVPKEWDNTDIRVWKYKGNMECFKLLLTDFSKKYKYVDYIIK